MATMLAKGPDGHWKHVRVNALGQLIVSGGSTPYDPPPVTGTTVTSSAAILWPSEDILAYNNYTITIGNTGSTYDIDRFMIEHSPNGSTPWLPIYDSGAGQAIGPGTGVSFQISGGSYHYIRARALCASGETTTASAWLSAS